MTNRNVIGIGACLECGAHVELRINSGRKVYYFCDGEADDKGCKDSHKWNGRASNAAIADHARRGWLGPVPFGYFPPTKKEGNDYAIDKIDAEKLRERAAYQPKRGAQSDLAPGPEPQPKPEPEPAPRPEPAKPSGADVPPRRRRII